MQACKTVDNVKQTIQNSAIALLLIKAPNCGVCDSVLAKLENLMPDYPDVKGIYASIEYVPELQGEYVAFAAPTLILFIEGREVFRQSRFIVMDELRQQLQNWLEAMRSESTGFMNEASTDKNM